MAAAVASLLILLVANLSLAAAGDAMAEFGAAWNLVLALDVINTVVVLFYLWRIWREKLEPIPTVRPK